MKTFSFLNVPGNIVSVPQVFTSDWRACPEPFVEVFARNAGKCLPLGDRGLVIHYLGAASSGEFKARHFVALTTVERLPVLNEPASEDCAVAVEQTFPELFKVSSRVAGLHAGAISTTDDFDAPLQDEFWTGAP